MSSEIEAGAPEQAHHSDVYDDYNKNLRPKVFYIYRIFSHTDIRAYRFQGEPVAYSNVENKINELIEEIEQNPTMPYGNGFRSIIWKKHNYFVIDYVDPRDTLTPRNAVIFEYCPSGANHALAACPHPSGNHNFKDGKDISDRRFVCINHMKKHGGGDLGEQPERYHVRVNHGREAGHSHQADKAFVSHEDSGTNTGPP